MFRRLARPDFFPALALRSCQPISKKPQSGIPMQHQRPSESPSSSFQIDAEFARSVWRKLFYISGHLRNKSFDILGKKIDVSFAQFPIMQFFFTYPDAAPTIKDLSSFIGLPSSAVSQAVDALVEENMLERVPSLNDHRSMTVRAMEELLSDRSRALRFFQGMLDAFMDGGYASPEEIAISDEIFVRLAESRTGGELPVIGSASDLAVPGLVKNSFIDPDQLRTLPAWILNLHFVTCLRGPVIVYYYGKRGRMTLNKLRFIEHLFLLSEHNENPKVKDFAEHFNISPGVVSQTLNAMIQDGMVERVASPLDRHVMQIRLTPLGLRTRRLISSCYTRFMQNFFSRIDPGKAEVFHRILDRFLEFLKADGKRFLRPDDSSDIFY